MRFARFIVVVVAATGLLAHAWIAGFKQPLAPIAGAALPIPIADALPGHRAGGAIRFATFNIHRGRGMDDRFDLGRVISDVMRMDADVVGLNEVSAVGWSGGNQAREIAAGTAYGVLFAPSERRWYRGDFGNAALTRLNVTAWRVDPLVAASGEGVTRALRNRIELVAEAGIQVFITHIDRGPLKDRQIADALQALERVERGVLLGDLNADRDHHLLADLEARGLVDALAHVEGFEHHIDWIIAKGGVVRSAGAIPKGSSDHPAYWAEISFDGSR